MTVAQTPPRTEERPTPAGSPDYTETMPCQPETARRARLLVSAALHTWGLGESADTALLIVSELVGNSIQHTPCRLIRVSVRRVDRDRVRIGVTDKSLKLPEMGGVDGQCEGGRGLLLIETLSGRWGYDTYRWGKTVWAELIVKEASEH